MNTSITMSTYQTSKKSVINMNQNSVNFEGIFLHVDSFLTPQANHVLPILWEEQPFTWLVFRGEMSKLQHTFRAPIRAIDVGCGCGFWAILMTKILGYQVTTMDKNMKAVEYTRKNASLNKITLHKLTHEHYHEDNHEKNAAHLVNLNPPYHIYPPELAERIPDFARGGSLGQKEFKDQLRIARHHLAPNGILIFNMMCLGKNGKPDYANYAQEIVGNKCSLRYTNIFKPEDSFFFLNEVYGKKYHNFTKKVSTEFPKLYYTCGMIKNDRKGKLEHFTAQADKRKRKWKDRIELHKRISGF